MARNLLVHGKLAQANQLMEEKLKVYPTSSELWMFKGKIFQKTNDYQTCLNCFQEAHQFQPNNKFVVENIFRYYLERLEYSKAKELLDACDEKLYPKHFAKMNILFLKNIWAIEDCFEQCKLFITNYPNAKFGYNQIIDICSLLRTPESIKFLNQLRNKFKTNAKFLDVYKKILRKQFRYYSLRECVENQLNANFDNSSLIEYLEILYLLKDKKTKIQVLESKLLNSKLTVLQLNSLFRLGKYSEELKANLIDYIENNPLFKQYNSIKRNIKKINQQFPTIGNSSTPNNSNTKHKVDLVYTWVDMNDEVLLDKFVKQEGFNPNLKVDDQNGIHRYNNNNEIMLSLLSSQKYISWVNTVFIVTNQQTFDLSFLEQQFSDKIKFITHQEIFPKEDIDKEIFHSNLIEAFLFNIPGLEEHFLYFNDDVVLGDYLSYKDLFSPQNKPYSFLRQASYDNFNNHRALATYSKGKTISWKTANSNALDLFNKENNTNACFVNIHFGIFLLRSECEKVYTNHKQEWKDTFFTESTRGQHAVFLPLLASLNAVRQNHQVIPKPNKLLASSITFQFELNEENLRFIDEQKPIFYCINSILDPNSISTLQHKIDNFN